MNYFNKVFIIMIHWPILQIAPCIYIDGRVLQNKVQAQISYQTFAKKLREKVFKFINIVHNGMKVPKNSKVTLLRKWYKGMDRSENQ